jgi:hypothetical protein
MLVLGLVVTGARSNRRRDRRTCSSLRVKREANCSSGKQLWGA